MTVILSHKNHISHADNRHTRPCRPYKTLIFTPIDCLNRIFLLTLPRLNGDFTQMSSNKLNE